MNKLIKAHQNQITTAITSIYKFQPRDIQKYLSKINTIILNSTITAKFVNKNNQILLNIVFLLKIKLIYYLKIVKSV